MCRWISKKHKKTRPNGQCKMIQCLKQTESVMHDRLRYVSLCGRKCIHTQSKKNGRIRKRQSSQSLNADMQQVARANDAVKTRDATKRRL